MLLNSKWLGTASVGLALAMLPNGLLAQEPTSASQARHLNRGETPAVKPSASAPTAVPAAEVPGVLQLTAGVQKEVAPTDKKFGVPPPLPKDFETLPPISPISPISPNTSIHPIAPTPVSNSKRGAPTEPVSSSKAIGPAGPVPLAKPINPAAPVILAEEVVPLTPVVADSAWFDHPKVRPTPRPGWFIILTKGPGYYSLIDQVHGIQRVAAPKAAYPANAIMTTPFYDADFRYIDDPNRETAPTALESLHRIHLGDYWLFGTGGQAWWRNVHDINTRLSGRNSTYDLARARVFGDLWYKDQFRIFAEFISAWSFHHELKPLTVDENRADIQNLFIDLKIAIVNGNPVYLRAGRQELLFGSQRLISTIDFANTRRTFDGVRLLYQSESLDFDAFWTRPVVPQATRLDSNDDNVNFAGAWLTYRPKKGHVTDLYYLYLDDTKSTTQRGLATAPTEVHTLGARYAGVENGFLWDFEGMVQLGDRGGNNIRAGNVTAGVGYHFEDAPMTPTVWAFYDWASGDGSPNSGSYGTFNQLSAFGHYYFGFLDLVGRQNVRDLSMHAYLFPTKWITVNGQYHFMQLDRATDALYGVNGAVNRFSANGSAGGNIGQELDLTINFHINRCTDILLGYSKLFTGDFIQNTGNGRDASTTYFIYNVRW